MSETGGRHRGTVVIVNPNGLHMRPASVFARAAQGYSSAVTIWKGSNSCNGKSLIDLMMLAAEPGTELVVEVDGDDAALALPALLELLASPSAEDADE
jgi:phosphotransferase system HPr (HPr) family protein